MISVVIPLYNKAGTIEATVHSVLEQTRQDFELVILDDGSTDGSSAIVRGIDDPRIRVVRQPNAGVAAARNRGAALAAHNLVAFLDADDLWEPNHLASLARLHAAFPGAALYATAYKRVLEDGSIRSIRLREISGPATLCVLDDYFRDIVDYGHPVHCSAIMVDRRVLASVGGFPEGVRYGEDIIACARLACAGTVAYSREATARYNVPPVSAERCAAAIKRPEVPDAVGSELRRLQAQQTRLAPSIARFRADWHRVRAMLFMQFGERLACLRELTLAASSSGPRLRDAASLCLLALPVPWQHRLVAWRRTRFSNRTS